MEVKTIKTTAPKSRPNEGALGFGQYFTDHMFIMDYTEGQGWHDARVIPYAPLSLDPSTLCFHYAQEIFEGLKAYRAPDGGVLLFRPEDNFRRLNESGARLCIPEIPVEDAMAGLRALLALDADWVPRAPDTSLYIRPFVIATDAVLGVRPSHTYKFMIILSPVGAYYATGMNPVNIYVEDEFSRASVGGTGATKAAANYAQSLKAQEKAKKLGYAQVLWLDSAEHQYIEEVGTMNVMFKIAGKVVTPALGGSILSGITRRSVLELLGHWGVPTEERRLSMAEVLAAAADGTLEEVFGTGTAAVISPVGELFYEGQHIQIGNGATGALTQRLYDGLTGIQWGRAADPFGWVVRV